MAQWIESAVLVYLSVHFGSIFKEHHPLHFSINFADRQQFCVVFYDGSNVCPAAKSK